LLQKMSLKISEISDSIRQLKTIDLYL